MKLKILACLIAALFAAFAFVLSPSSHAQRSGADKTPPPELVAKFDAVVQKRFLEARNFGIRRIMPVETEGVHFNQFSPRDETELKVLEELEEQGWKVALYLYGRTVNPFPADSKNSGKFNISYRVNVPVTITAKLKRNEMPVAKSFLGDVKKAFIDFQTPGLATENAYDFGRGGWNYYARPVRASQTSCLGCHTDYVITQKLGDGKYKFRQRELGDVNGVIVYAFRRK